MEFIERIVTDESLVRRNWLSTEEAVDEVVSFEERFGEPHVSLARHAAFPVLLTPELVNLIRVNFLDKTGVPWIAEQDFLLSPMCRPVGNELFEVEPRVREVLLYELGWECGAGRPFELGEFLLDYTESSLGAQQRPEITQLQKWVALAYVSPEHLVEEMTRHLLSSVSGEGAPTLASHIKIATAYELVADALERSLPPEEYRKLAADSRLMAYYWYGNRKTFRSDLEAAAAAGPAAESGGARPETLTVFLDWVRKSPAEPASPFAEEIPGAEQSPESWGAEERLRLDAALARLAGDPGFGTAAYRVIVVSGEPGPARTEFVRRIAESRRPGFGGLLYLDLSAAGRPNLSVRDIRIEVFKRLTGVPPPTPEDEATWRSGYGYALFKYPTLLVLDNVEAEHVEALSPPPQSLLVVTTSQPEVAASSSVYVFDMDAPPPPPPTPGRLTLEEQDYLAELLTTNFMVRDVRPAALLQNFLPVQLVSQLPAPPVTPRDLAVQVVRTLANEYPRYLPNLTDFLSNFAGAEAQARMQSLRERFGPPVFDFPPVEDQPVQAPSSTPQQFFGREQEASAIIRHLIAGPRSLVVIDGPAGIGKTSLARVVAYSPEVRGEFRDGVVWLGPRYPEGDLGGELAQIALTLNLPFTTDDFTSLYNTLRRRLGQYRLLIVMDETFDEADVETIDSLSPAAVIYTSRGVPRELVEKPHAFHLSLRPLAQAASVELLRALAPDFIDNKILERLAALSEGDPKHLHALAERLKELSPSDEFNEVLRDLAGERAPEEEAAPARNEVLVLYSHSDERHADELRVRLSPLVRGARVVFWDDTALTSAPRSRAEFEAALGRAKVAVVFVSADFLASDFIAGHDQEELLKKSVGQGMRLLPVALSPSHWGRTFLAEYQFVNDPSRPLGSLKRAQRNEVFAEVAREIRNTFREESEGADGGEDIERTPLDLSEVNVPSLIMDVQRELITTRYDAVHWRASFPAHRNATVRGDQRLLHILFNELLENAFTAAIQGNTARPEVRVTGRGGGDRLRVEISDNGRGLPDVMSEDVFREPVALAKPRHRGLGLYTANRIALRHGGKIELLRTGSGGTTFVVELPLAEAQTPPPPRSGSRAARYLFYLSHAKAETGDGHLEKFYLDLTEELRAISGRGRSELDFFYGSNVESGDGWDAAATEALQSSMSLVCIYSRSYFASVSCGKEFEVFRRRLSISAPHGELRLPPIIPVLWDSPERIKRLLPPAAAEIQYFNPNVGESYEREGLYYLMRLQRYRDEYQEFLRRLAVHIFERAEKSPPLPPLPEPLNFEEIPNAFHTAWPGPADRPDSDKFAGPEVVQAMLVVGSRQEMHDIREDVRAYDETPEGWRPFDPDDSKNILYRLAQVITSQGLMYETHAAADDLIERLREAEAKNKIVLLVLDPWAVRLDRFRRLLSQFDQQVFFNCAVLTLWNPSGAESELLRMGLENEVRQTLSRAVLTDTVHMMRSAEQFERKCAELIARVRARIIERARLIRSTGEANLPLPRLPKLGES